MYLDTKAAANTIVEFLLEKSGVDISEVERVYLAGSFGKYMDIESAITIGLYPDPSKGKIYSHRKWLFARCLHTPHGQGTIK